ncbi:CynX/NimT family MFS transporter [Burkholderia gladioli]|uniref:MFS transporter n=1 Tax=Burkholderia gladioli TaxID=28095 RepID=UPI001FC83901|nr:MFS transporter [Burkholderia gladioli]
MRGDRQTTEQMAGRGGAGSAQEARTAAALARAGAASAPAAPAKPGLAGEWPLIVAIVLVAINLRPGIVSMGPLLPQIQQTFAISHATASLMTAIPDLLMGLLALPTPWLARRFGRNAVLMGALLLLSLATVARAFAPNTFGLLATTVGVGAGIAIAGALFGGLIKAKFPSRVALLMGIYATALSFGSTLAAAATGFVASHSAFGWRLGAGVWGVLGIVAILGARMVARSDAGAAPAATAPARAAIRLPLRDPKAWLVALYFACDNLLFYALLSWLPPSYHEHGLSSERAGLVLATFMAVFTVANPVIGSLSRHHDRRGWLLLCAALAVAGLAGIAWAPMQLTTLWVALSACGLAGGFTLGMTLPLDNTHSAEEANTWNAFSLLVGYLIAACGPFAVGLLRDLTGSFDVPMACLVGVGLAMALLSPFLKPRELRAGASH